MNAKKSILYFSLFLFVLSLLRFWDKDILGFFLFFSISSLFFSSYCLELYKIKLQDKIKERRKVFYTLSVPRIVYKQEGNSEITTLIVPSLELFNEVKNHGDI